MGPLISSQVGALVASTRMALCSTSMKNLKESRGSSCRKHKYRWMINRGKVINKPPTYLSRYEVKRLFFRVTEYLLQKHLMALEKKKEKIWSGTAVKKIKSHFYQLNSKENLKKLMLSILTLQDWIYHLLNIRPQVNKSLSLGGAPNCLLVEESYTFLIGAFHGCTSVITVVYFPVKVISIAKYNQDQSISLTTVPT